MLYFLDILLTLVHVAIIGFNLLGWIMRTTRKAHLVLLVITAASWFILGIWYGIGYCPVTDWQWEIKAKLGESNLPSSFIKYYADAIAGTQIPSPVIDAITGVCFGIAAFLSVYFNFWYGKKKSTRA